MGLKALHDESTYLVVPVERVVQFARSKSIGVSASSLSRFDTLELFGIGFRIGRVPSFLEPVLLFKQANERRDELEQRNG
jgi:hypothetical protein